MNRTGRGNSFLNIFQSQTTEKETDETGRYSYYENGVYVPTQICTHIMNYYVSNLDFSKADSAEMWVLLEMTSVNSNGKKSGRRLGSSGPPRRSVLDGDREDGR